MLTLDRLQIHQGGFDLAASWSVPVGSRIAIIGPSGAGKSTLLLAIAGFVPLKAGRIFWAGENLAQTAPGDRPLSLLFQDQNLFPHLTVAQNLGLGLNPSLKLTADQHGQITQALARVGLAGMEARKPVSLSGGQLGRTALARALLRAKPLLLLDEPFAALGPALKAEMLDLVAEMAAGMSATVVLVTHDPADAKRFADQTVLVADHTAYPPMPTQSLFSHPPAALAKYLGT